MPDAHLIESLAQAEELAGEWDALAVAASRPVVTPAWTLAWLRRVAPALTKVRIIAVRDRGQLVGVLPFYAVRHRGLVEYRLMSSDYGVCVEPLALPGREWDVAAEAASVLAACRPRPDLVALGPLSLASHWTHALSASWPGPLPGVARNYGAMEAPVIFLRGCPFEDWFTSLSPKMRSNVRRTLRQFEAAGGRSRRSTAATLRADAEAFARLHAARWQRRGDSRLAALGDDLTDWLEELGRELIDQGRFRMGVLEVDGAPICVDLSLRAGDELAAINVGWDERYAKLAPPRIAAIRLVEDACAGGVQRVHLGRGGMEHKLRLANGSDPVACAVVLVPSARLATAYAHVLPGLMRDRVAAVARRTLPPRWLEAMQTVKDLAADRVPHPAPPAPPCAPTSAPPTANGRAHIDWTPSARQTISTAGGRGSARRTREQDGARRVLTPVGR